MTTERTAKPTEKNVRQNDPTPLPNRPSLQSWLGPYNEGRLDHPDGLAVVTGPCGDTIEISLWVKNNRIVDSRFQVKGCAVSRACASIAASLAKGKELEEAYDLTEADIAGQLQQIPSDHSHCPVLARDTLRKAIEDYVKQKKGFT